MVSSYHKQLERSLGLCFSVQQMIRYCVGGGGVLSQFKAGEAEPMERGSAHPHVPSPASSQPGGGKSGKLLVFLIIKAWTVVVLLETCDWL